VKRVKFDVEASHPHNPCPGSAHAICCGVLSVP